MPRTPTNTTKADAIEKLFGSTPDGILAQEAAGQRELVNSEVLPFEINGATRADFEALGFRFGDPVDGDPLFVQATLPKGWTRAGGEHSMWSYLLDERGIRRVAIFYKAAHYDRRADMGFANPGMDAAMAYIYGDDSHHPINPAFNVAELDQMRVFAEGYLEDARRYPETYDADGRAKNLIKALDRHAAKNLRPRSVK